MASSISWPEWMPRPLQSGFSMQPEDRRIASSTVGTSFQKGFDGDVCIAECTVQLNPLQAKWFEQWERDELVHGSRWFAFPVWYAGEVHREDCRFKTRPKVQGIVGNHTSYSFSIYIRHRTELLPECMVKILACWPPCYFETQAAVVNRFPKMETQLAEISARIMSSGFAPIAVQHIDLLNVDFLPLFAILSRTTASSVSDALSELEEQS